jgi:hypothetical protein
MSGMSERFAKLEPPVGFGPSLRLVLSMLRRRRPPLAVLAGCLLVAVTAMVCLAVAADFALRLWANDTFIVFKVSTVIVGPGIPLLLAVFGYRGIKRALVGYPYRQAMFLARLVTAVCVPVTFWLIYFVATEHSWEPSMAVPYAFLAFTWLPEVLFRRPSARAYLVGGERRWQSGPSDRL